MDTNKNILTHLKNAAEEYKKNNEVKRPIIGWSNEKLLKDFLPEQIKSFAKYLLKEKLISENYDELVFGDYFYNISIAARASGKTYTMVFLFLYNFFEKENWNGVCYRETKLKSYKALLPIFRKALRIIGEITGLNIDGILKINENNTNPMIKNLITKQEIRFEGMGRDDDLAKGLDFQNQDPEIYIWLDEFLSRGEGNQINDTDLLGYITDFTSSLLRHKNTKPRIFLTSNPMDFNHEVLNEYYHPFLKQHSIAEREKIHKQEYKNMEAFNGLGLYILDASYKINTKLNLVDLEKSIFYWKENNYNRYIQEGLGINIGSASEAFKSNENNLQEYIKNKPTQFHQFIAGGDIGTGKSNTAFNLIGITGKNWLTAQFYILDEFYWHNENQGMLIETERAIKIIEFYVSAMKKYNIEFLTINIDSQNKSDIAAINKMIDVNSIKNLRAQGALKVGLNSPEKRIKNLTWLLAEKRLFANVSFFDKLLFELSTAKIDKDNKLVKKGKSQFDRIDAIDYAFSWIIHLIHYW